MKKLILLLILCMLLVPALAACNKKGGEETPTTAPNTTENVHPLLADLPVVDYNNEEVTIFAFSGVDLVNYDDQSTPVMKAQFDRATFVNDLLNCQLKMQVLENGKTHETQKYIEQNHTGNGGFDLIMPHPNVGLASCLTGGYCADLLEISNLNFNGVWNRESMVRNWQANGKLFIVSTDFTIAGEGTYALVYNKQLYQTLGGTSNLYQVVKDGDWTLDYFLTELKNLDASGTAQDGSLGTYAVAWNKDQYKQPIMIGADVQVATIGNENQWTLTYNTKDNLTKLDGALSAMHTMLDTVVYYEDAKQDESSGQLRGYYHYEIGNSQVVKLFTSKKTAFMFWDIGSLYHYLLDADFDVGYLPSPKLDTNQSEYRHNSGAGITMIPSVLSAADREKSGAVLEALTRYSYVYNRPTFFETVIGGRLSENMEDYEAIELIFNTKQYCIVDLFADGMFWDIAYQTPMPTASRDYVNSNRDRFKSVLATVNTIGTVKPAE